MKNVTIVMYHFVRDLAKSRFPEIKGLTIEKFKGQLLYLKKHFSIISATTLMEVLAGGVEIHEKRPAVLSFDDGYIDHFTTVFPILDELGMTGIFFPPARAVLENEVLDVNKIHFILASVEDKTKLNDELFRCMVDVRSEFNLPPHTDYLETVDISGNRWDIPEVAFFKRMLQRELPEAARGIIVDMLFQKFVTADETSFAREMYLDFDQIRCMQRHGMSFGCHGYDHAWLDRLSPDAQERDIDLSLEFMARAGIPTDRWAISYPFGGWNESLLGMLKRKGCVMGFTTQARVARVNVDNALLLPRLNTNDLPFSADVSEPDVDPLEAVS